MTGAAEWLDRADAVARKQGPAYEALSREYHPKAIAALRAVLDRHRLERRSGGRRPRCADCIGEFYPCPTVRDVAAALGVVEP